MIYTIYYKDGSKKTIPLLKPLTGDEIKAQIRARPDYIDIDRYGYDPNDCPIPEIPVVK